MENKRVAKWQERASPVLELGERVTAAASGTTGGWLFWLLPEISWFRDQARAYLVTDRNVYVCRLSSTRRYRDVQGVLEKRPLGRHALTSVAAVSPFTALTPFLLACCW
jgi:hypothetical protein